MAENILEIKNLRVRVEKKEILRGVNLNLKKGEVRAILGPNGSGKSVLCQTIAGNPKYRIVSGKIIFENQDISKFLPEKRAKLGIALSWQEPPAIKGIKLASLLERISWESSSYTSLLSKGKEVFLDYLLEREVNVDFSGGEKKLSELLQVLALKPKLAIFDEIDSGLDLENLRRIALIIKEKLVKKNVSLLIITHNGEILNFLKPDFANVMIGGKVISKEKNFSKVIRTIKKYGYEKCRRCLS